jgi:hypothetical protein
MTPKTVITDRPVLALDVRAEPGDAEIAAPAAPFAHRLPQPPGFYHNHAEPCGAEGCVGGARAGNVAPVGPPRANAPKTTAPPGAKGTDQ